MEEAEEFQKAILTGNMEIEYPLARFSTTHKSSCREDHPFRTNTRKAWNRSAAGNTPKPSTPTIDCWSGWRSLSVTWCWDDVEIVDTSMGSPRLRIHREVGCPFPVTVTPPQGERILLRANPGHYSRAARLFVRHCFSRPPNNLPNETGQRFLLAVVRRAEGRPDWP